MGQDQFLHMRISDDVVRSLDALRREEEDLPGRSEMVRRLIARAAGNRKEQEGEGKRPRR